MRTLLAALALFTLGLSESRAQVTGKLWDQDQLSNVTVMLYQPESDTSGLIGSGTIVSGDSLFYIFTASHVARVMDRNAKVIFRMPGDKPGIVNLPDLVPDSTTHWQFHKVADIAMIRLSPPSNILMTRLHTWSFPLSQVNFSKDLPTRDADLTFFGYPVVDLEMEHFSPLVFTAYLASGLNTQLRYDTRTKCNFFFLNVPSIQGCSGSGVYFSVAKGMYYGGNTTVLIGIVHGTQGDNTGGKLAAITPSYYIRDFFVK